MTGKPAPDRTPLQRTTAAPLQPGGCYWPANNKNAVATRGSQEGFDTSSALDLAPLERCVSPGQEPIRRTRWRTHQ
jgi:hypothetical protein